MIEANLLERMTPRHIAATMAVRHVLTERSKRWRVALLGGAVRDLLVGREPRDLDFVVEGCPSRAALAEEVAAFFDLRERTGLGGCRCLVDGVEVDLWTCEDNAVVACASHEELIAARGTTFDVDCALIDVGTGVFVDGGMRAAIRAKQVELSRVTPRIHSVLVAVRAAQMIERYGWALGPDLRSYLCEKHSRWQGRLAAYAKVRGIDTDLVCKILAVNGVGA